MTSQGFNPTQIKQLGTLFDKNNKALAEHTATIVDVLSQTIEASEKRTNQKIDNLEKELKHEFKTEISKVREDLNHFVAITPTKFQVERLEKSVFGKAA